VAAWLLTIARNVSINMLPARRFDPIDPEVLLALEAKRPCEDGPRRRWWTRSCCESRWLDSPGTSGEPWSWPYGFTACEIRELDGVPLGTVKTRIRAAMMKLRSKLMVSDDQ